MSEKDYNDYSIMPFCKLSDLSDKQLTSLAYHEKEAYGYEGFGEYRICSNKECRRVLSIDDVFKVSDTAEEYRPLPELEENADPDHPCPDCNEPTHIIYNPEILKPFYIQNFRDAFGALLTDSNNEVQGNSFAYQGEIADIFTYDLNYKETFDKTEFIDRLVEILGRNIQDNEPFISFNRNSLARPYRNPGVYAELASSALYQEPKFDDLPVIGATRYDSNMYPLCGAMDAEDILSDKFGTVLVAHKKFREYKKFFNIPFEKYIKIFGQKLKYFRERQAKILASQSHLWHPKYLKGVQIFDAIDEFYANKK